MTTAVTPRIVHETQRRIRLRWRRLLHPNLAPDYLEAWLENLPGVESVRVNGAAATVVVVYDGRESVRTAVVDSLGHVPEEAFGRRHPARPRRSLADAAVHGGLAGASPFLPPGLGMPLAALMGAPAVLQGLDTLFNQGLKVRVLDMATVGFSLLRRDYVAASSISAMIVVGEYLRRVTEDRYNGLLRGLMAAPVETVRVERDGVESALPYDAVRPGDVVHVDAGELVPVDGAVRDGEAVLDRSSITGEFDPQQVHAGDAVTSGSSVSEGRLAICAEKTGRETVMARIAEFMEQAVAEKSDPERRSDRLADLLAPVTLGMGSAIYAATRDANRALSVLTVDYACAVKLPAPVVIKASMHAAGQRGILVKSGSGLDAFAEADTLVFDKTGTLTTGELTVAEVVPCRELERGELLRLAASVEDRNGHPVGRAIVREAASRDLAPLEVQDCECSIAHGVSGRIAGQRVRVGSRHFIADDCGVDCSELEETATRLRAKGASLVYISRDKTLLGVLALRETVRDEASRTLAALRGHGVKRVVVLTGDHQETASQLAERVPDVDEIRAGLMPEDKAEAVRELQRAGAKVAVIGDGINDAPAFVAADVGICMSRATGLARESAQIVLMHDRLDGLSHLRRIAERSGRVLKSCFATGVGVNTGLLLAASAGLLTPTLAAGIHNLTTFSILGGAALAAGKTS